MSGRRPWVRGGLPWLRSGPLYRVSDDALILLDAFLAEHPYRRIDLYGSVMVSRDAAHEELHRAFDFPDWCGNNWDAFNDCFGHFVHDNDGALLAVVWRDVPAAGGRRSRHDSRGRVGAAAVRVR